MEIEEPSSDPISALAAAGNALHDISRRYHFSAANKERLTQGAGLIQKVFIEIGLEAAQPPAAFYKR
jgi:hypothetical protein